MVIGELLWWQMALLALPILPNLWCIWHASRHSFPSPTDPYLWMLAGVFLPLLGGLAYLIFGMRRARNPIA